MEATQEGPDVKSAQASPDELAREARRDRPGRKGMGTHFSGRCRVIALGASRNSCAKGRVGDFTSSGCHGSMGTPRPLSPILFNTVSELSSFLRTLRLTGNL